eukprot:CAMPEP_0206619496 /NCGR_PEP_ID=MMETSP0325_2-20121206/60865_1 /ASSEMBLY_ACC=CAM_ASM_000347 /TAXON_ID=2866 /ORGANISM="Crypthecodinium cohnii, Strain Seligo" /LENGTH=35 /DNA_ID= /DNA_START= /DNA_END= /DNA_ORIENTATION=
MRNRCLRLPACAAAETEGTDVGPSLGQAHDHGSLW